MKLTREETDLTGRWVADAFGHVRNDDVAERIEFLTRNVLEQVGFSRENGAWETLFWDPADGRLWERTYPQSELHGGGPPRLRVVSEVDARARYDFESDDRRVPSKTITRLGDN